MLDFECDMSCLPLRCVAVAFTVVLACGFVCRLVCYSLAFCVYGVVLLCCCALACLVLSCLVYFNVISFRPITLSLPFKTCSSPRAALSEVNVSSDNVATTVLLPRQFCCNLFSCTGVSCLVISGLVVHVLVLSSGETTAMLFAAFMATSKHPDSNILAADSHRIVEA